MAALIRVNPMRIDFQASHRKVVPTLQLAPVVLLLCCVLSSLNLSSADPTTEDNNEEIEDYDENAEDCSDEAEDNDEVTKDNNEETKDNNEVTKDNNKVTKDYTKVTEDYNEVTKYNNKVTKDYTKVTEDYNEVTKDNNEHQIQNISHDDGNPTPTCRPANLTLGYIRPVEIEINGNKTQLTLTSVKNDVMFPDTSVWVVKKDLQKAPNIFYRKLSPEETRIDGSFLEDVDNMAMLLAQYKDGQIYYEGMFEEGTQTRYVKSVPETWWEGTPMECDPVIPNERNVLNYTPVDRDGRPYKLMNKPLEVMYPKLLIVLENNFLNILGGNVTEAIKYVGIFWNAVNQKYSQFYAPQVNILISGIIIEQDENTLPYISATRNSANPAELNGSKMIQEQEKYFEALSPNETDFLNYDSVFTMTSLDTGAITGTASLGMICHDEFYSALIRGDGKFSGLQEAIHELGRLLGLPHDGGKGTEACKEHPSGKINTVVQKRSKGYSWSDCSKKLIKEMAWRKDAECLGDSTLRKIF